MVLFLICVRVFKLRDNGLGNQYCQLKEPHLGFTYVLVHSIACIHKDML